MATSTTQRSLSMKLLIDNKTNKVLFAVARKGVIDFLFSLLTIPVGSIVKFLTTESMVGCIGNLYKSVETIDDSYIISDKEVKISLLNPAASAKISTHFSTESSSSTGAAKQYYTCIDSFFGGCIRKNYFTDVCGIVCPDCNDKMIFKMSYVRPNSKSVAAAVAKAIKGGFVQRGVTYGVMDDLTVTPMSTISSILMLNKFHVKDVGSLEERIVSLGIKECLGLLKASLQSKTVLTDVFISKKLGVESTLSLINS